VTVAVEADFDKVSQAVLDWMHAHGFGDATLTEDAGHGAYDVEAGEAIAEINIGAPPSRPNVQRLDTVSRGAGRRALYFSVRGFTTSAEEWATNVNIALFAFSKESDEIVPSNAIAEELDREPPTPEKKLLDAAARAVTAGREELHKEQQLSGLDDDTRKRIEQARENKRMRRDLFG
jgi:hypothetical protein